MSSNHQETIICPSCGEGQPFVVWDSINVSVDPTLKQSLLEGALTTLRCRHCGHEAQVAFDCLYHDMDHSVVIWLKYPDDDGACGIDPAARAVSSILAHGANSRLVDLTRFRGQPYTWGVEKSRKGGVHAKKPSPVSG